MSASTETTKVVEPSLTKSVIDLIRYYLGGRRGLILLTVAILGTGMFFNWGWLVAAGIAPLLLALAPCAAMCALGMCMNKKDGKSCSTQSGPADQGTGTSTPSTAATTMVHDEPLVAATEQAISKNDAIQR